MNTPQNSWSNTWRSRGYLPHFDLPDLYRSITFRLYDSVPGELIQKWKEELHWREDAPNDEEVRNALKRKIVLYEDAGHGACWLANERIATVVQDAILHFDEERYRLLAWCIMPNHVHVLIQAFSAHPLNRILHSWKSFSAQKANELLARKETFWAREYYDRYIRDDRHFAQTVAYIEQNPVKAGFVANAESWRFGRAFFKR